MKKKKGFSLILVIVLAVAGLSLLLYPLIANTWNSYRQSKILTSYERVVEEAADTIDYEAEWARAHAYNDSLMPSILPDSFAIAEAREGIDSEYYQCLNLSNDEDGLMGYIEIPKINEKIPIFHSTSDAVLQKAAGHLEGSSLPVGGENTHCVIAAHRGLPSASLFTDLDKLKEGDHFLLSILDEILCYEVDQILIVEPEDTDALQVEPGRDLVTLLTCTPYGVNTQRMLVRGTRVDYVPEVVNNETLSITEKSLHTSYGLWVIVGLAIAGIFILILWRKDKKFREKIAAERAAKAQANMTKNESEEIQDNKEE